MKELGVRQEDLAEPMGVSRGGVGHYLAGRREPSVPQLRALASKLKWSMEELLGDGDIAAALEVRERRKKTDSALPQGLVYVKRVVGVHLSAGTGVPVYDWEEEDRTRSFDSDWMASEGLIAEHCRLYRVKGDSMYPTVFDGDDVMVNLRSREPINDTVFALIADDGPRLKRLRRTTSERWEIVSDNDDKLLYPDEPFLDGQTAVWGEVVWQARRLRRGQR